MSPGPKLDAGNYRKGVVRGGGSVVREGGNVGEVGRRNVDLVEMVREAAMRDWNGEHQDLAGRLTEARHGSATQLLNLARDIDRLYGEFVDRATRLAEEIVSESQAESRVDVGGVAGGRKFLAGGILFKVPYDPEGLYGSDEGVRKASGHSLKSLMACMDGAVGGLCFPLMAVVDVRGRRVEAMSVLPISNVTLRYGSADCMAHVYADDAALVDRMKTLARLLNVAEQVVETDDASAADLSLWSACDVEGHRGRDGRLYVVDLARYMPPEDPRDMDMCVTMYRRLRPEFVVHWRKPLAADAFSGFNIANLDDLEADIVQASAFLRRNVVPTLALHLAQVSELSPTSSMPLLEQLEFVVAETHRHGVNLRMLGAVLKHSPRPHVRRLLLTEMAARSLRQLLRGRWLKLPAAAPASEFIETAASLLREILSPSRGESWPLILSELFNRYGDDLVTNDDDAFVACDEEDDAAASKKADRKIDESGGVVLRVSSECPVPILAAKEVGSVEEFERALHGAALLARRVCVLCGIVMPRAFCKQLEEGSDAVDFARLEQKVVALRPVVKRLHKIPFEQGTALSRMAVENEEGEQYSEQAQLMFEEALRRNPSDARTLHNYGLLLYHRANRASEGDRKGEANELYQQSAHRLEQALALDPRHPATVENLARCVYRRGVLYYSSAKPYKGHRLVQRALDLYRDAAALEGASAMLHYNWANALFIDGAQYLREAADPPSGTTQAALHRYSEKRLASAIAKYQTALKRAPRDESLLRNYALCLFKLASVPSRPPEKRRKAALVSFEQFARAAEISPEAAEVYFSWGHSLTRYATMDAGAIDPNPARSLSQAMLKFEIAARLAPANRRLMRCWLEAIRAKERVSDDQSALKRELRVLLSTLAHVVRTWPQAEQAAILSALLALSDPDLKAIVSSWLNDSIRDPSYDHSRPSSNTRSSSSNGSVTVVAPNLEDFDWRGHTIVALDFDDQPNPCDPDSM